MNPTLQQLLTQLNDSPMTVAFKDVIDVIDRYYEYAPTRFTNGLSSNRAVNEAGTNEGSCRIFAFAQLNKLTKEQTLHCFGDYYRKDVLESPEGNDHANIRNFIQDGWGGIGFEQMPLTVK